jgi:hypothetical protein
MTGQRITVGLPQGWTVKFTMMEIPASRTPDVLDRFVFDVDNGILALQVGDCNRGDPAMSEVDADAETRGGKRRRVGVIDQHFANPTGDLVCHLRNS